MDELTEKLATSFAVNFEPNSTAAQHPRFAQYKSRCIVDQQTRRLRILQEQKKQRFDFLNHVRNLSEDAWDNTDAESVDSCDSMEVQVDEQHVRFRKPGKYYRNQLMYSEWLVDVPEDFEQEWLTVICPWGKRCLVVASKGRTHAYAKNGYRVNSFSSHLPGGSFTQKGKHKDSCILDCIFNETEGVYYVLDLMCWKSHPVYDSETEFRYYWLTSKFSETPELLEKDTNNPYKFIPLNYFASSKSIIEQAVNSAPFDIDGILFYHKRAHYNFGSTPLVVWLKPYMLPEILGVQICEKLQNDKPDSYTTYKAHMDSVAKMKEKAALEKTGTKGKSEKGQKGKIRILQREKQMDESGDGQSTGAQGDEKDPCDSQQSSRRKKKEEKEMYARKYGQDFRMDVMFSEWMEEVPEDVETGWFVVVCPVGKRSIVLARDGLTLSQSKTGLIMEEFSSLLPGGHMSDICRREISILDTLFSKRDNTFYILDGLLWNAQELYDCEAEFRSFWLKQRFEEIKGLGKTSRKNNYIFKLLQTYPASVTGIERAIEETNYEIDGLLFYRKRSIYMSGSTSDVLWLKPYMLPDLFPDIKIPEFLLKTRPASFNFKTHKEKVQKDKKEQGRRRRTKKKAVDLDRLVDDISRMYITKHDVKSQNMRPRQGEFLSHVMKRQNQAAQARDRRETSKNKWNSEAYYYGDYGYDMGYQGYGMNNMNNYGNQMMGYPGYGYQNMYGMCNEEFRPWGYIDNSRDEFDYIDHSREGFDYVDHSREGFGRARDPSNKQAMSAYMLTHNKFKK